LCQRQRASPFGGFELTAALYNHGKDALDRVLSRTKNGTSFNDNLVTEVGGSCSSLYRVGLMNFRCLDIHSSHGRSRKDALQGATQPDRRAGPDTRWLKSPTIIRFAMALAQSEVVIHRHGNQVGKVPQVIPMNYHTVSQPWVPTVDSTSITWAPAASTNRSTVSG
jgi:hypothetical protein